MQRAFIAFVITAVIFVFAAVGSLIIASIIWAVESSRYGAVVLMLSLTVIGVFFFVYTQVPDGS